MIGQTQHGQSSEIVTSSSGSANAPNLQVPGETSSSTAQVSQPQITRGNSTGRRGIQRQPIVWDAASNRPQAAPSAPLPAGRGFSGTRPPRGSSRARRPLRGMFSSGRRGPRGGS